MNLVLLSFTGSVSKFIILQFFFCFFFIFFFIIFKLHWQTIGLETLSVDNGRARLIILLLGDPHLLEGGQRSKDGSSDPYRVFSFWWSNDLDLDGGRCQSSQFLLHSVSDSREHGGSSRENNVSVQVLSDINVALHDGVVSGLVDSCSFHT